MRISREIVLRRNRDLQAQRQALLQLARLSDDNGLRNLNKGTQRSHLRILNEKLHGRVLTIVGMKYDTA